MQQNPDFKYYDQDALNVIFRDDFLKLPEKFNSIHYRLEKDLPIEKRIYHYCGGGTKPHPDFKNKYQRLWFEYFIKTPFATLDSLGNLWNIFETVFEQNRSLANLKIQILQTICKRSIDRERIIVTYPQNVAQVRDLIGSDSRDIIFNASNQQAIDLLIREASGYRGKKIVLILVAGDLYSILRQRFIELGWSEGEDFLNIYPLFLPISEFRDLKDPISKNF